MPGYPVDPDCIFCRIIKGEIPSSLIYEDEACYAFLDINPVAEGHSLLIPKGHYPTLLDVPGEEGAALLPAMQKIGAALMAATGAEGFNCLQNVREAAGQVVFHSHWHIIPRKAHDGLRHWRSNPTPAQDELAKIAAGIRAELS